MPRYINIDDDRNCYIGNDGEYERYNIDPDVLNDAVEVIRCKDCKHWDRTRKTRHGYHYCNMLGECFKDDFYCADAEGRTDE